MRVVQGVSVHKILAMARERIAQNQEILVTLFAHTHLERRGPSGREGLWPDCVGDVVAQNARSDRGDRTTNRRECRIPKANQEKQ